MNELAQNPSGPDLAEEQTANEQIVVVGYPITHSMSPFIHGAAFKALDFEGCGIHAQYLTPENIPKNQPERLESLFQKIRTGKLRQLAVTMPHKQAVVSMADEQSDEVKAIGAANTITRTREGKIWANNTDWRGVYDALLEAGSNENQKSDKNENQKNNAKENHWEGKKVLIIGAGGAARAAIYAVKKLGMEVFITNRTHQKAQTLVEQFGIQQGELSSDYHLILNATAVGMNTPDEPENVQQTPFPSGLLRPEMTVFDVVYKPLETRLLQEAQATGCKTISGLRMLIYQAIEQLRLWTAEVNVEVAQQVERDKEHLAQLMTDAAMQHMRHK